MDLLDAVKPGLIHAVTCQRFHVRCSRPRLSCIDHDLTLSEKSINYQLRSIYDTTPIRMQCIVKPRRSRWSFLVENSSPLSSFSKPQSCSNSLVTLEEGPCNPSLELRTDPSSIEGPNGIPAPLTLVGGAHKKDLPALGQPKKKRKGDGQTDWATERTASLRFLCRPTGKSPTLQA